MVKVRIAPFLSFAAFLTIVACNNFDSTDKTKGAKLASFGNNELYFSDLPDDWPDKVSGEDSIKALRAFVDKWIEKQALLEAADLLLSDKEKDKTDLINDYKTSLLLYEYEKKIVESNLDTFVKESELKDYYDKNNTSFELKKNIVRIRYVKLLDKPKEIAKAKSLMLNTTAESDSILRIFCEKTAENFYLEDNWLFFEDILREIPLNANYSQERFLNAGNKFVQLKDDNYVYLLLIKEYRVKSNISPFEFEKDKIKSLVLYKRKLDLIKQNQETVLKHAEKNKSYKIFIK